MKARYCSLAVALLAAGQTCHAEEIYLTEQVSKLYKAMTAEVLSYCYSNAPDMYSTLKSAEERHSKEFELAFNAWIPYQDLHATVTQEQALEAEREGLTFAQKIIAEAKQYDPRTYCEHLAVSLQNKDKTQILGSLKSYEQSVQRAAR